MTTLDLLTRAGLALYGERWKQPLARDLGLSHRMMRYYMAGEYPLPPEAMPKLKAIVVKRARMINALAARL